MKRLELLPEPNESVYSQSYMKRVRDIKQRITAIRDTKIVLK